MRARGSARRRLLKPQEVKKAVVLDDQRVHSDSERLTWFQRAAARICV